MGGKYEPGNVIAVEITACNTTTANHVMWHYANWQLHGKEEDKLAYRGLAGFYRKEEIIAQINRLNGENARDNRTGFHARSAEQMTANGKKGGTRAAVTNMKNKTAIFGRSPEKMSEDGKKSGPKGAKTQHSQRYKCLVTGYISTPCGLSHYQKARGIDTKLRVKIN